MSFLVVSASLNPESKSRLLARRAYDRLVSQKATSTWIDLREYPLPFCGAPEAWGDPNVEKLAGQISSAQGILLAAPIYNYDVNAALKNLIELTGKAWEDKTVGFLCAAGGNSSYMSIMSLANSLMLDFRTLIVPRFVYASGSAFEEGKIVDTEVLNRVDGLADKLVSLVQAIA